MVITKKIDFLFIRFPIILPIIYSFFIYSFPSYENLIIFFTLMLLAEPHFGATLPFFFYSKNLPKILTEKIKFIFIPILIIFFTTFGYFYFYQFFLLIFLGANFYHVTRQSYGVCRLYNKNIDETIGFDTGPGNTLIDAWTKKNINQPYDDEVISEGMLKAWEGHPTT